MKSFVIVIYFLLYPLILSGQQFDQNWYFGSTGVGIEFTTCVDTLDSLGNGMGMWEGCVTMSDDQTGALLFYSNGLHVFNSSNDTMLNGYYSGLSNSLTQTVAVKKPGSSHLFYIFTTDVQGGIVTNPVYPNAFGINYTEIDMNLDGGRGGVISKFNRLKDTSNCEKLVAVQHGNGQDIWLIGHEYGNHRFFVYKITTTGIDTIPDFYDVGPDIYTWQGGIPGISNYDTIGELKASPNGSKLAFTTYYNGITALFDFDKYTGAITNPIPLVIEGGGYGVSFSPGNTKLYISAIDTANAAVPAWGKIFQFSIGSGNPNAIQNSRRTIATKPNCGFASMKIAQNGRIYVTHYGSSGTALGDPYLGVINFPDLTGANSLYMHNGYYLHGEVSCWGLCNSMENPNYCFVTGEEEVLPDKDPTHIFPNPAGDECTIQLSGNVAETVSLTIRNMLGQEIRKKQEHPSANGQITIEGLGELPHGIYTVELKWNDQSIVQRLIH